MTGLTIAEVREYVAVDSDAHGVLCRTATGARILIDLSTLGAVPTVYLLLSSSHQQPRSLRSLWAAEERGDVVIVDCATTEATDRLLAAMGGIEDIEDVQKLRY